MISQGTHLGFSKVTWLRRKLLASVIVVPWEEAEDVEEEARWPSYSKMASFSDRES